MKKIGRWLRGAAGVGVTWAASWVVVGLATGVFIKIFQPGDIGSDESSIPRLVIIMSTIGFLSGIGFAATLSLIERRRTLHQLSLGRIAVWGMLGAGVIPLLIGLNPNMGLLTGTLGGLFASGSLAAARRSSVYRRERKELDDARSLELITTGS